jgi:catechol 2,3-dioxygenase-like lactoylglutathione lyase family enzyme
LKPLLDSLPKGSVIDHVILTVSDLARSVAFYERALQPLGIEHYVDYDGKDGNAGLKGFGKPGDAFFWLKEGTPTPTAVHLGFVGKDHAAVDAFYKAAIEAGGRDNGAPGFCLEYDPGYYAAYVFDPDGYNVEAVHKQ